MKVVAPAMDRNLSRSEELRRKGSSLLLIVLTALFLRLLVVAIVYQDQLDPARDHWAFGWETGRIARSIAQGEGFANPLFEKTGPTAWLTPVYPYLVAAVFKVFGVYTMSSAIVLLSLNGLFSALTCVSVFLIAGEAFGQTAAAWAGWVWAFFPYSIYLAACWVWETSLTTLLFTWLFLLTLWIARGMRLRVWAGYGLLWGVAALTNPAVLSVLPFLLAWICFRLHKRGDHWGGGASIAMFVMILTVAPWFVRNYRTFHRFIPFRDAFWLVAHVGNNGDTSHWAPDAAHPSTSPREEEQFNRLGELNYMAEKKREVVRYISDHPRSFLWVTLRRVLFTWTGYWSFSREYLSLEPIDPWNILISMALFIFMVLGIRRGYVERNPFLPPFVVILLIFPVVYYITIQQMPYRHPIDPEIAILSMYGAMSLARKYRKQTESELGSASPKF